MRFLLNMKRLKDNLIHNIKDNLSKKMDTTPVEINTEVKECRTCHKKYKLDQFVSVRRPSKKKNCNCVVVTKCTVTCLTCRTRKTDSKNKSKAKKETVKPEEEVSA